MISPLRLASGLLLLPLALAVAGCHLPGRPGPGDLIPRPEQVLDFESLYNANCAGCHGANGMNGPATDLANPEYQALIDDATLHTWIDKGEPRVLMPGFGAAAGGSLTEAQVNVLVRGMRERWSPRPGQPNPIATEHAPSYKASGPGDPNAGAAVYASACARCHGAANLPAAQRSGRGVPGGNILDGSLLALANAQTLRSTLIAGRPDIGQPDWRGDIPGHPLSDAEITNLTAWLLAQRPATPGQPYPNSVPNTPPPGQPPAATVR